MSKTAVVHVMGGLMIASILVFGFSVYLFQTGYHNIDLGQNMRYLEAEWDKELLDVTNQGRVVDGIEAYQIGWWQVRVAYLLTILSVMMFTAGFCDMLYMVRREK